MDGVDANNDDLRLRRLSLIDFASEDDFLLSRDFNSLGIMKEDKECNNMEQLEAVDHCKIAEKIDALEKKEYDPPLLSSLEPERVRKNGKYNLRKSLAWDSAFFTSAGVLDPEELSSMIVQVDKNEKRALPMISEDIQKSSDSFSTLASENVSVSDSVALESIEGDLFEDVRASIQNSGRSIGKSNLKSKVESRQQETRKPPTSRRFDLTSQNKLKDRSASKKQADGLQAPERILKQSSSHPRSGQILAKLPSNSALSSKRPSFGHNLPAISTGGTKSAAGRGAPVSSRNTAPKVTQISTAAKKEQSTSSEISVNSSDSVEKSSFNSARRKVGDKASPPSGSTRKSDKIPSRIASRVKTSIGNSHLSSYLTSTTKPSSGISPASSVSEWSTSSSSSTLEQLRSMSSSSSTLEQLRSMSSSSSTLEQQSSSSRASGHAMSSKRVSTDSDASLDGRKQVVGPHTRMTGMLSQSVKKASAQSSLLPPASTKPSGLRLPSPKIGYFDGVKTSSMKSDPVPGGLTKIGGGSVSISGGQNKAKPAKLQPARVLPKSTNHATQPSKSNTNLKSHKPIAVKVYKKNELDEKTKEEVSKVCAGSNLNYGDFREKMTSQENEASSNVNDMTVICTDGELV